MIITLTGENQFAIRQTLNSLADRFVAKFGPHSYERVDGEQFELSNLPSLLQGASLFAPQRLVVLKDAAQNKPLWDALGDWVTKVPTDTTLVVIEPSLDKRTRTYKALKSGTDFKEFSTPSDAQLVQWLCATAKERGAQLTPSDAQYLVERAGRDQWRLSQEAAKLTSYSVVTRELIDQLVEPTPEGSAFELLDAALAGQTDMVQKLVQNLKTEEDPYKLFGLLTSQVHTLATVVAAGDKSADQIAKDSGLHPFVVRKSVSVAKKLGATRIAEIIEQLASCDMQLKTTGADPWFLLELMFKKLAKK